jgi:DNA-binding LacI/PurR family transcriptional regulator
MNKQKVTTYDIARRAGVDQSSVSKVLNGATNFRPATIEKIRRTCRELGYVPNAAARSLRTKQAGAIAVNLPLGRELAMTDPFVAIFLAAVHEQAGEKNYSVVLNCDPPDQSAGQLVELIKSHRADGVIFTSVRRDDERVSAFAREDIPCVLCRHDGPAGRRMVCVDIDNRSTGARAVRFLRRKGHRKIGLVCETEEWICGADFQGGARAESEQLGVELTVRETSSTFQAAHATAMGMLVEHPGITALVATTALTVFGVLEAVREAGRDVTVLGVDSPLLRNLHPLGPRIVSPIDEMARAMTTTLIDLLETQQTPPPQMLQTEIVDEHGQFFRE